MDLMLKAANSDVLIAKLTELGLADAEGNSVARVSFAEPFIWATKPVFDTDGNTLVEGVPLLEYHLNVRDLTGIVADPTPAVYKDGELVSGTEWGDVTWIDPIKVTTPALVWG